MGSSIETSIPGWNIIKVEHPGVQQHQGGATQIQLLLASPAATVKTCSRSPKPPTSPQPSWDRISPLWLQTWDTKHLSRMRLSRDISLQSSWEWPQGEGHLVCHQEMGVTRTSSGPATSSPDVPGVVRAVPHGLCCSERETEAQDRQAGLGLCEVTQVTQCPEPPVLGNGELGGDAGWWEGEWGG